MHLHHQVQNQPIDSNNHTLLNLNEAHHHHKVNLDFLDPRNLHKHQPQLMFLSCYLLPIEKHEFARKRALDTFDEIAPKK